MEKHHAEQQPDCAVMECNVRDDFWGKCPLPKNKKCIFKRYKRELGEEK
jgi:hypothetical protein